MLPNFFCNVKKILVIKYALWHTLLLIFVFIFQGSPNFEA